VLLKDLGDESEHLRTLPQNQWIGLRENLNRKPWFLPSNIVVSCKFSHHPILCWAVPEPTRDVFRLNRPILEPICTCFCGPLCWNPLVSPLWAKVFPQFSGKKHQKQPRLRRCWAFALLVFPNKKVVWLPRPNLGALPRGPHLSGWMVSFAPPNSEGRGKRYKPTGSNWGVSE